MSRQEVTAGCSASRSIQAVNHLSEARLAQPAERKALNLVVVGSRPTVGVVAGVAGDRKHM